VSVYFINVTSLLYISCILSSRRIQITPVILTFIISIISIGIGGIAASTLMLLLVIYYKLFDQVRGSKLLLPIIALVAVQIFFIYWDDFATYLISNLSLQGDIVGKLEIYELLSGNERYSIWGEYLDRLSFERFVTGINIGETFYGRQDTRYVKQRCNIYKVNRHMISTIIKQFMWLQIER